MKYFKNVSGSVFAFAADGSQDEYIASDLIPISYAEADALRAPVLTAATYAAAVQSHMDAAAVAAGYDDIKTAVTYADEPAVARFQTEGSAFRAWRSLCWDYCYTQLAAVQSATRTQPTIAELVAELPTLVLP